MPDAELWMNLGGAPLFWYAKEFGRCTGGILFIWADYYFYDGYFNYTGVANDCYLSAFCIAYFRPVGDRLGLVWPWAPRTLIAF